MNITIFSTPKAFVNDWKDIQISAIKSWIPYGEVILCGNDFGVAKTCKEYGLVHIPDVDLNLKSQCAAIENVASNEILARLSSDCVIMSGLESAYELVKSDNGSCISSNRFNCPHLITDLDLEKSRYKNYPRAAECSMDIHVYKKGFFQNIPKITLGMGGDDNWLAKYAVTNGVFIYSKDLILLHQHHSRAYLRLPETPGWIDNHLLYIESGGGLNLDNAQFILEDGKLIAQ